MVNRPQEIWKAVPGFLDYEVSNIGRVRSLKFGKIRVLKPNSNFWGYHYVVLCHNCITTTRSVHILVMLAFVGSRPEGLQVCHNDGNLNNNRLDNLRYDTPQSNRLDAVIHGTLKGLTPQQREQIRQERLGGVKVKTLIEKYGVSKRAIVDTSRSGLTQYEFSYNRARAIREEYANGGTSYKELAEKYRLGQGTIWNIVNGKKCLKAGGPIKGIDY